MGDVVVCIGRQIVLFLSKGIFYFILREVIIKVCCRVMMDKNVVFLISASSQEGPLRDDKKHPII